MAFERRPDGALVLRMHVPLAVSLFIMLLFFAFALVFLYGLFFEDTTAVKYRGIELGFDLPPLFWDVLFGLGALGMMVPGIIILIGLVHGGKPHVRLDNKQLSVRGRPIARDLSLRWDQVSKIERYRIAHGNAIRVRGKDRSTIELSDHVFPGQHDFQALCREIECRAHLAANAPRKGAMAPA